VKLKENLKCKYKKRPKASVYMEKGKSSTSEIKWTREIKKILLMFKNKNCEDQRVPIYGGTWDLTVSDDSKKKWNTMKRHNRWTRTHRKAHNRCSTEKQLH
jgi:hypothetical protein